MKRLVALVITLALAMGLFCFNVIAAANNANNHIEFNATSGYTLDYPFDSQGSAQPYVNRTYTVTFTITNLTDKWVIPHDESFGVKLTFGSGGTNYQMMVNNEINCTVERSSNSSSMTEVAFVVRPLNSMVLAPREVYICSFDYDMTVWGSYTPGFTVNYFYNLPNSSAYTIEELLEADNLPANAMAYLDANRHLLEVIRDTIENAAGTSDLNQSASDASDMADSVHDTETQFYTQNSQALANSGITNPNFEAADREAIGTGFSNVNTIFNGLWSSLGAVRNIYMYVLMIGLATFIIRHRSWVTQKNHNRGKDE